VGRELHNKHKRIPGMSRSLGSRNLRDRLDDNALALDLTHRRNDNHNGGKPQG